MEEYSARAVGRAMKIQEVILRAISGQILWMQAAHLLIRRRVRAKYMRDCS